MQRKLFIANLTYLRLTYVILLELCSLSPYKGALPHQPLLLTERPKYCQALKTKGTNSWLKGGGFSLGDTPARKYKLDLAGELLARQKLSFFIAGPNLVSQILAKMYKFIAMARKNSF